MRSVQSKAVRDAIASLCLGLAIFGISVYVDLHEAVDAFMMRHENWELDEIILALLVLGSVGFVYGFRRHRELKAEIVERERAQKDAIWYAFHDPLSQLFNRHYLDERVVGEGGPTAEDMPNTVFALDLDNFKSVNDLLGHQGGDELLKVIADRLKSLFPDDEIIRVGGDEFLVLSRIPFGSAAQEKAREAIRELSQPVSIGGLQAEVGASFGICDPRAHAPSMAEAIRCADLALYAAKRQGRKTACLFEPAMKAALHRRIVLERDLREAISNDVIVPHYQPLIWLETGEVHGFEALARWTNKDGEHIPPSIFIGIAEEAQLISDLSDRLLRRACLDARGWPEGIRLAFNISPHQLIDKMLAGRIIHILEATGFPPQRLSVEITESALIQELAVARGAIESLRDAGVRIALDDFGTGYSSLSQLASMPFDELKIDQSFVSAMETDEKQIKVVRAIIGLSQGLGIETAAEGIEDERQLERLKRLGCDLGQGYLFGRPMPASDVAGYLASHGRFRG